MSLVSKHPFCRDRSEDDHAPSSDFGRRAARQSYSQVGERGNVTPQARKWCGQRAVWVLAVAAIRVRASLLSSALLAAWTAAPSTAAIETAKMGSESMMDRMVISTG